MPSFSLVPRLFSNIIAFIALGELLGARGILGKLNTKEPGYEAGFHLVIS